MTNEDLQQIQSLVTGAGKVLVLTHANPSVDAMASALALYLAISKMGKDVTVAMESPPLVEVSNLVGIDKVKTEFGNGTSGDLLITYKPYQLGDFEKVTYLEDPGTTNPADDAFKLTLTPRPGYIPDPKNFQFTFTGGGAGNFDLIVTIELLEPTQAGKLYDAQMFANAQIINIDNHDPNKDYGKFNLVEPDAASLSEIVTFFLRAINAQLDPDIAGNLYQGIIQASNNFQSPRVAAATFEAAAICLRTGAKQAPKPIDQQPHQPVPPMQPPKPQQPQMNSQQNPQYQRPQPVQPLPQQQGAPQQGQPHQPQSQQPRQFDPQASKNVPKDWNQPKAFRGTSSV